MNFRERTKAYLYRRLYKRNRVHRQARVWSNQELRKFSHLFTGKIINVSAKDDSDKNADYYKNYFSNADKYHKSNYSEQQDLPDEIFIDLTAELDEQLAKAYDVVFNHTTLEHIFEVDKAIENLCQLSRDIVIIVVPFMQQSHGSEYYDDYWRLTPLTLRKFLERSGFSTIYESANDKHMTSVYLFIIATCHTDKWKNKIPFVRLSDTGVGSQALTNSTLYNFIEKFLKPSTDE